MGREFSAQWPCLSSTLSRCESPRSSLAVLTKEVCCRCHPIHLGYMSVEKAIAPATNLTIRRASRRDSFGHTTQQAIQFRLML